LDARTVIKGWCPFANEYPFIEQIQGELVSLCRNLGSQGAQCLGAYVLGNVQRSSVWTEHHSESAGTPQFRKGVNMTGGSRKRPSNPPLALSASTASFNIRVTYSALSSQTSAYRTNWNFRTLHSLRNTSNCLWCREAYLARTQGQVELHLVFPAGKSRS
jgi:hypothetical protein